MHDKLSLGKNTTYPRKYSPGVLDPISRADTRKVLFENLNILDTKTLPSFYGYDLWQAYEVSWINQKGKPCVASLRLTVPCSSESIVESKSLKLYLNSFNQHVFSSIEDVQACIEKDISLVVGAAVDIQILNVEEAFRRNSITEQAELILLDDLDIHSTDYQVNPSLLKTTTTKVNEKVYSHLLRSSCPVTDQPDWGSLFICYAGPTIEHEGLLKYIISYRNNQEFHEQCVERIFSDIWNYCKPENLLVAASYMRRGGIDINPVRSSSPDIKFEFPSIARQ